jgi:hypothetical protein
MKGTNLHDACTNIFWFVNPHHLTTVVFYPVGILIRIPDDSTKKGIKPEIEKLNFHSFCMFGLRGDGVCFIKFA